jgi:RNA polymerase-binding transcription factor DksA
MRCYICDADSETVQFEHGEYGPCADCQAAIFECLQGYPDVTNDPDDEFVLMED